MEKNHCCSCYSGEDNNLQYDIFFLEIGSRFKKKKSYIGKLAQGFIISPFCFGYFS